MMNEFHLERYFAKYEFSTPYLLCCSDPESFTVEEVLSFSSDPENSKKKLMSQWLGYTESQGAPELKKEIAKLYDNISVTRISKM
jgi:hypothetical protein